MPVCGSFTCFGDASLIDNNRFFSGNLAQCIQEIPAIPGAFYVYGNTFCLCILRKVLQKLTFVYIQSVAVAYHLAET